MGINPAPLKQDGLNFYQGGYLSREGDGGYFDLRWARGCWSKKLVNFVLVRTVVFNLIIFFADKVFDRACELGRNEK